MTDKKVWVALVVVAIIAIGGYLKHPQVQTTVVERPLGATPGADLVSPYFAVNNVETQYLGTNLNGATTTCSWKSGASTSTLAFASFQINTATNTALFLTLATSTAPNATGTTNLLLAERSIGANVKGTYTYKATSTALIGGMSNSDGADVIAPNTYVTWGVEGSAGFSNPNAFGATCKFKAIVN